MACLGIAKACSIDFETLCYYISIDKTIVNDLQFCKRDSLSFSNKIASY